MKGLKIKVRYFHVLTSIEFEARLPLSLHQRFLRSSPPMLFLPLLFLLSPLLSQAASLLAIDYGTDSFKASLIKPGVPFDVLINRDSKRKTPSLVVLRGEERAFGGEAGNLVSRLFSVLDCA